MRSLCRICPKFLTTKFFYYPMRMAVIITLEFSSVQIKNLHRRNEKRILQNLTNRKQSMSFYHRHLREVDCSLAHLPLLTVVVMSPATMKHFLEPYAGLVY